MIAEIPLGVVALEVVLCEGRCRITCTVEAELRVYTFDAWDGLWHDAEGAISELFDAPELFVASCIGRNGCNLLVGCSCKGSLSAFNRNLEIWIAPQTYAIEVLIGAATYAVVALLHMRRIRRVPLALAMKVQE